MNARATVDAATHTVKIERIDVDFGAAKVLITGTGTKTPEGQVFAGRAEVRHIPVDRLGDYWPLEFAPGGRQWALANLSNGEIDVAAEFALSAPGNDLAADQGRSPGRPDRLSRHDRALHAAHARAAGRVGQGALRGRHAAFRRGERHRRGPAHDRRHDRPHRAGRPGAAICQPSACRSPDRRRDVIRFLARPKLGLPQRHALRLPAGRRRGRRSTCRCASRCSNALTVAEHRHQGRGGSCRSSR